MQEQRSRCHSGTVTVRAYLHHRCCSNSLILLCGAYVRVGKMTARPTNRLIRLSLAFVFVVVWTTAIHLAFLLAVADASEQVQQLHSSIRRLNALKQLMNAEQVWPYIVRLHALPFILQSATVYSNAVGFRLGTDHISLLILFFLAPVLLVFTTLFKKA